MNWRETIDIENESWPDDFPPSGLLTIWNIKTTPLWCKQKGSVDFFGIDLPILQSKMRKPNRRTIWTRRFPDFPRLYGQPAADCKRERKYVTGGLLNTEETTAVFFRNLWWMRCVFNWMCMLNQNETEMGRCKMYQYVTKYIEVLVVSLLYSHCRSL